MTRERLIEIAGTERLADSILSKGFMRHDFNKPEEKWRRTLVGAFISKYPTRAGVLDMMCAALGKKYVVWGDCTKVNLRDISDYINSKVSANSATTYIHLIQALLGEFSEERVIPVKSVRGAMKTKHAPSQHVALTQDELGRFDAYRPKTTAEADVKALFMRAALTGARCSDAKRMGMGNVHGGILSYVSQKTRIESHLPLHRDLAKYLEYNITRDYCAEQEKRVIRKICRSIGMTGRVSLFVGGRRKEGEKWEFCTMHTARRTFCTVLASLGVPVEAIRAMAGHTSTMMTDRYIVLDGARPGREAMAFFNGGGKAA